MPGWPSWSYRLLGSSSFWLELQRSLKFLEMEKEVE
jgi:hypothetical protein